MRTSSRKAKGRRLQNWVRDELLSRFTKLSNDDIYCAIMGESGADIKLSPLAQTIIPYSIECKNKETFTGIYKIIEQASTNSKPTQVPLGIIKKNNLQPLAIIDARHFLDLVSKNVR
jgi:hypothetical protein|tara:strand:+ start:263 stop:613 length:351 start_codon:yes stop_codon:yes gene_type:complete